MKGHKPFYRRRQWHPTPVLWPGKSHGWRSLVGCSPRGREESDMTEQLNWIIMYKMNKLQRYIVQHREYSPVQFSRSVVSNSLRPHEWQHARPPCPSPTTGVHSNSRPSGRWCHPAISSSVILFPSCPQSLPGSESFPMSQLFPRGDQSIGVSALASVLPMNSQDWSPLEWTGCISLQCKGLSRVFSNMTLQKHQFFGTQPSSHTALTSIHDHWKNHSLD